MVTEELDLIESDHGVAVSVSWTWLQPDGVTPVDLTGKTFTCHVRGGAIEKPGAVVLAISTANGRITTPGAGVIQIDLTDAISLSLPPGNYWCELIDGTIDLILRAIWRHRRTGRGLDGL